MTTDHEDDPFAEETSESTVVGEPQNQEWAASAAPAPQESGQRQAALDRALDKLPQDRAVATARALLRHGVSEQDPVAEIIDIAIDADVARQAAAAAATSAADAAGRIEAATKSIGDDIYKQALKAGSDVQGVIKATLHAEVVKTGKSLLQAIQRAADSGAQKIEQASAGLDDAARQQQQATLRQWKADLAATAKNETKARYARSWLAIAVTILLTLGLGAGLMFSGLYYARKILPWNWTLRVGNNGRTCGTNKAGIPYCLSRYQ